eukprot:357798-Chlamydomonas_euryale.AAC.19
MASAEQAPATAPASAAAAPASAAAAPDTAPSTTTAAADAAGTPDANATAVAAAAVAVHVKPTAASSSASSAITRSVWKCGKARPAAAAPCARQYSCAVDKRRDRCATGACKWPSGCAIHTLGQKSGVTVEALDRGIVVTNQVGGCGKVSAPPPFHKAMWKTHATHWIRREQLRLGWSVPNHKNIGSLLTPNSTLPVPGRPGRCGHTCSSCFGLGPTHVAELR